MNLVDRNIIVCGGQQHTAGSVFEYFSLDPHVLNTETLVWSKPRVALGRGPTPRSWHTATLVDQFLIFFGGRGLKQGTAKYIFNDLPCFDLTQMTWEHREPQGRLPSPRYWHSAALVERKLMIWGGCDSSNSAPRRPLRPSRIGVCARPSTPSLALRSPPAPSLTPAVPSSPFAPVTTASTLSATCTFWTWTPSCGANPRCLLRGHRPSPTHRATWSTARSSCSGA